MSVEHWVADFPRSIASSPCLWKPIVRRRPPPAQPVCPPRGFVPFVVLIPLVWARCHPGFRGGPSGDFSGAFRMAHSCSRKNSSAPRTAAWTAGPTPRHTRWDVCPEARGRAGPPGVPAGARAELPPSGGVAGPGRAQPRSAVLSSFSGDSAVLLSWSPWLEGTLDTASQKRPRTPLSATDPSAHPRRWATNKILFSKYQLNGYV